MDGLKNIWENILEKLKSILAEQQESELVIRVREKYDELPPPIQKIVFASLGIFGLLMLLWWPVTNIIDSSDFNERFEARRQVLKELLQVQRDIAGGPNPIVGPAPLGLKTQFDQKIASAGVKPEQIKEGVEIPIKNVEGAQERGFMYHLEKLTIRQAVDLAFDLEHTDPTLRLLAFQVRGQVTDPHYYDVVLKLVNFAPKIAEAPSGLLDAAKKKGAK